MPGIFLSARRHQRGPCETQRMSFTAIAAGQLNSHSANAGSLMEIIGSGAVSVNSTAGISVCRYFTEQYEMYAAAAISICAISM
jgi:hypothetical protein